MIPYLLFLAGCPRPAPETGKGSDTSQVDTGQVDTETGSPESGDSGDSDSTAPDSDTGRDTSETGDSAETGEPPPPCDRTRPWVFVDAGVVQTCGIHDDGCAECWGIGEEENSADWDTGGYHWQGEDQPPAESFVMLDMLKHPDDGWFPHTCGIRSDGSAICWGDCSIGQCDVPPGSYADLSVSNVSTWVVTTSGVASVWGSGVFDPGLTNVASVQMERFALVIDTSGIATAWGQTGYAATSGVPTGTFINGDVGHYDACALNTDGTPICWWRDEPENWATYELTTEAPAGPFTGICVGSFSSAACALDATGNVTCWGGDFAPGSLKNYPTETTFTQIACGYAHACGVTTEGGIECWGYDWHGETLVPT